MQNSEIARMFDDYGDILEIQGANPFRVRAYRNAARVIGDLAESLIKRDVGQKDSAPLLPGFGGLLDLLDSILFTGPVAYLLWLALPLAGTTN